VIAGPVLGNERLVVSAQTGRLQLSWEGCPGSESESGQSMLHRIRSGPFKGTIKGTREGNIVNFYMFGPTLIDGSWEINADATKLEGKWFTYGGGTASGKLNLTRVE